jgi:L-rhamnose isomerase
MNSEKITKAYQISKEAYAEFGVDIDKAIADLENTAISLHCWQGDDVAGFEGSIDTTNLVTGNYPNKARNAEELRMDIDKVFSLCPGEHRVNLHAIYAETDGKVPRDELTIEHFKNWISWAKENKYGLDYNASFFAHPNLKNGLSLSSPDEEIRSFWIRHAISSREIAYQMGKQLNDLCVNNIWIPDGCKDNPANRMAFRNRLKDSLDKIFETKYDSKYIADVLECKLFGIGTECFVTGSLEFYLSYAVKNNIGICLDTGHFHPTEQVSDKLSALAPFFDQIMLHISRGVRWDSDHVVTLNEELVALMSEIKRSKIENKIHMGLDFFDGSINRVAAWTIGLRNSYKARLIALLEPSHMLELAESEWDLSKRLALMEEFKSLPFNAVWDMACLKNNIPVGVEWIEVMKDYEKNIQKTR